MKKSTTPTRINMSEEEVVTTSTGKWLGKERPVSPTPSSVSMKSNISKDEPLNFRDKEHRSPEHRRPVSPSPSMNSDMSKGEPLNVSNDRVANTTQLKTGETSEKGGVAKGKKDLKRVILEELGRHEHDPKLCEIVTFNKSGKKDSVKYNNLFSGNKTVLMIGVPGIGKTFQTRMFMIDWAQGRSNKDIKALVSLDFTELNTMKDEAKSMESLLKDFFSKKNVVLSFDDKDKICFILDGLEKCKLPLDFVKNRELKDLKEPASMDVLLTNLIKGKLLPEAHVWIVSQPEGVQKIPSEYVKKTVHCEGKNIILNNYS
ncbi:hypothetical protein XENOCAPTIV_009416 [Xenoophorus captivus]|uniref:NACHT domain-containing protein n=1 Tax=Xenoophorus captivus TaxID=1517983 RepID=A0ABV0QLQ1_9TELE